MQARLELSRTFYSNIRDLAVARDLLQAERNVQLLVDTLVRVRKNRSRAFAHMEESEADRREWTLNSEIERLLLLRLQTLGWQEREAYDPRAFFTPKEHMREVGTDEEYDQYTHRVPVAKPNLEGARLIAGHYHEKFGVDIAVLANRSDLPSAISAARALGRDKSDFSYGFSCPSDPDDSEWHRTPVTYLKAGGREYLLISDSIGINNVLDYIIDNREQFADVSILVDRSNVSESRRRQADVASCVLSTQSRNVTLLPKLKCHT